VTSEDATNVLVNVALIVPERIYRINCPESALPFATPKIAGYPDDAVLLTQHSREKLVGSIQLA
jgi:hypothetical protein